MKISKLFHWLYSLVMLLPIFAVGVTCGYVIFNKNAYQSYYGQDINEKIYHTLGNEETELNTDYYLSINSSLPANNTFIYVNNLSVFNGGNLTTSQINMINNGNIARLRFYVNNDVNRIEMSYLNDNNGYSYVTFFNMANSEFVLKFNVSLESTNDITQYFGYYTLNSGSFLDNVFYYSIDKVQQNPLFNWAYDSFLATPITYITALFGIANDHIAVMLMSYWLAISVIWLVFDLIMYVPLLVHRWIDKGVIE